MICLFFFFNDTATTEIYTLSLHDALPISNIGFHADHPVSAHRQRSGKVRGHGRLALAADGAGDENRRTGDPAPGEHEVGPPTPAGRFPRAPFGRVPITGAPNHSCASRQLLMRSSRASRENAKINPSARPKAAANPSVLPFFGATGSDKRCGGSKTSTTTDGRL